MTNTQINEHMHTLDNQRDGTKALIAGLIIALVALFFVGISTANGQVGDLPIMPNDTAFTTLLSSREEVPSTTSNASGRAHFVMTQPNEGPVVRYQLIVHDGENITAAHLHCAAREVNGPVVVNLYTGSTRPTIHGELASGVIRNQDILAAGANCSPNITNVEHLMQAMREGKIYANVHSTKYQNGEIRGQVLMRMPNGFTMMPTSTTPIAGITTQYTTIKNGIHTIMQGFELQEINSLSSNTSRFVVTISHDHLHRINDILPNIWQMIQSILNR